MDTDTMLEVFKYFNYRQLAYNSLVSKRFRNLIRTNRYSLALLYVENIDISNYNALSTSIRNGRRNVKLNHENLDRLLTDPFIYICSLYISLDYESDSFNLFAAVNGADHRLRCEVVHLTDPIDDIQNCMEWINGHVICDEFVLEDYMDLDHNQALLNFFVTGAQCTSSITLNHFDWFVDLSEIFADFVQEFMDHKECDEFQFVTFIKSNLLIEGQVIDELELQYVNCFVKAERYEDDDSTTYVFFEFNNNNIGKKLQLTVIDDNDYESSNYRLFMKIEDL